MNYIIIALLIIILIVIISILYFIFKQSYKIKELESLQKENPLLKPLVENLSSGFNSLKQEVNFVKKELSDHLKHFQAQTSSLYSKIGEISKTGENIKELYNLFKNPKIRGNLGETLLKDIISQFLSKEHFKFQYNFKNGTTVDLVIKTSNGLIPIDSKFSQENYEKLINEKDRNLADQYKKLLSRDLKKHIDDVSSKYIIPQEGTIEFAVVYLPNESLFHYIITEIPEILKYSQEKKVILVSPNSFIYFLRIIILAMEGKRLEQSTKYVIKILSQMNQDFEKFEKNLTKLQKHFSNAQSVLTQINSDTQKIHAHLSQIKMLKGK